MFLSIRTSFKPHDIFPPFAFFSQTFLNPFIMSQTAKSTTNQGTDAKDKGAPAPAATSKTSKTGEPGFTGNYKVSICVPLVLGIGFCQTDHLKTL